THLDPELIDKPARGLGAPARLATPVRQPRDDGADGRVGPAARPDARHAAQDARGVAGAVGLQLAAGGVVREPLRRAGCRVARGPPATTSRSIIEQKWGWRRVAASPTTAISSRSTSGAGRRDSASFSTPATISVKVALTIAR